ncbi:hypothetical protein LAZ67_4001991 [Cordylochernes scorpioides]|uniref:Uncharacterized protein n=1 Tax=Cordylochernes scorpioides TaxID=51811 RepID=A0ABY6KCF6_9ARAC|nr:hypothetical protein LAZ67_4001991 [Cordylochernes scorpioides]
MYHLQDQRGLTRPPLGMYGSPKTGPVFQPYHDLVTPSAAAILRWKKIEAEDLNRILCETSNISNRNF